MGKAYKRMLNSTDELESFFKCYAWHQLMMIPLVKLVLSSLGFLEEGSFG